MKLAGLMSRCRIFRAWHCATASSTCTATSRTSAAGRGRPASSVGPPHRSITSRTSLAPSWKTPSKETTLRLCWTSLQMSISFPSCRRPPDSSVICSRGRTLTATASGAPACAAAVSGSRSASKTAPKFPQPSSWIGAMNRVR